MKQNLNVVFANGDGIGKEITPQIEEILNSTLKTYNPHLTITSKRILIGEDSVAKDGIPLTEEAIAEISEADLVVKGPTNTPSGKGAPSANVGMRKAGKFNVCVRPIEYFLNVPTPYNKADQVRWVIWRENTEGLYGMPNLNAERSAQFIEMLKNSSFSDLAKQLEREGPMVIGFGVTSQLATESLMKSAIQWAFDYNHPIVTITHKSNIFKELDGRFVDWCIEAALKHFPDKVRIIENNEKISRAEAEREFRESGRICVDTCIADAFLEKSFKNPENFAVVVANNYNGDLFSDYAAALIGGLGIAPGINVNFETNRMIAEATHGTAPDIMNQNKANPSSELLSVLWALRLKGGEWQEYAFKMIEALQSILNKGYMTGDFARYHQNPENITQVGTKEFLARLEEEFESMLVTA